MLQPPQRKSKQTQLPTEDFEPDVHVAARCMRVGADFLVRLLNKTCQVVLRHTFVLDAHFDREPEAAAVARANGNRARNLGLARILLVLLGDEV